MDKFTIEAKKRYIIFLLLACLITATGFFILSKKAENTASILPNLENEVRSSGFFELKNSIEKNINLADKEENFRNQNIQIGITSHHLPTALPFISEFYQILESSSGPREKFIIIGPDHFERCQTHISMSDRSYLTPFGEVEIDEEIENNLASFGIKTDENCFDGEHSIAVQVIFIKKIFPNAKIVPIIFSAKTSDAEISKLAEIITPYQDKIAIIASVDFSHYLDRIDALKIDRQSALMIENMDGASLESENVDSPAAVRLAMLMANKFGEAKSEIIGQANSFDFTGDSENTTGYINAIFIGKKESENLVTLFFVGDIMLSRAVGDKMKKLNNWNWPFEKIGDYLAGADLTFGNLEGPISSQGRNVGSIYSFRADPKAIEGLKYAGFDVLSVANNHIGDWAKAAMDDTFEVLKSNGIDYAGGGFSAEEAHSARVEEVNGTKIGFLAYTALGAKYTEATASSSGIAWLNKEKMAQDIAEAKKISDLVIVSIHFGDEYKQKSNNFQKDIARSAIDAGAALIIGHHPHVVEEIEQYKDGWIAYGLDNFIFDQTFSKETMEGMLLKVTLEDKGVKNIEPIKIKISKEFQASIEN